MFELRHIDLHYGKSQILYNINLRAEIGNVTAIVGSNGVGKTSLLRVLSGTHKASSGSYEANGINIMNHSSHQMALGGIAYVPQGREIFPLLTVRENLETGFACITKEDQVIPDYIFEMFPVLKKMLFRRGGDLSGGQQQQLAIARALIMRPKLLLLDEPTEGIQPNIIQQIGEVIKELRDANNMAIILVEQYFDFAFDLSDYIYAMKRGKMLIHGCTETVDRKAFKDSVSI